MKEIKLSEKDKKEINKPERLQLVCRKCNHKWFETRPKGYHVRYDNKGNFLIKIKTGDIQFLNVQNVKSERISEGWHTAIN